MHDRDSMYNAAASGVAGYADSSGCLCTHLSNRLNAPT